MAKEREESLTIETRLDFDAGVFECIERILGFFARVRGKVWRELIIKEVNPNTLKSTLIREEMVTARHANSLIKEVQAKASSIAELRKERRESLRSALAAKLCLIISIILTRQDLVVMRNGWRLLGTDEVPASFS